MYSLPCSILSLDIQDIMGSHSVNIVGNLHKHRLDVNGATLETEKYKTVDHEHEGKKGEEHGIEMPDYDLVKNQIINKEGCRIDGYFVVNKVPGNFHISSHAYGPIIQRLLMDGLFGFDVSHKVNHISFGEDNELKDVKRIFGLGEISPLDGTEKPEHDKSIYEYYMKVVPTTYVDMDSNTFFVHQFISNHNKVHVFQYLPAVYFR